MLYDSNSDILEKRKWCEWLQGGGGSDELVARQGTDDFYGSENTLYYTIMVDMSLYVCPNCRMYTT